MDRLSKNTRADSSDKVSEQSEVLPRLSIDTYFKKHRTKGDPFSQDAYCIVEPKQNEYFVSLCDGVTNAFFSEFSAQAVAQTLAKHHIQDLDSLAQHIEEMQNQFSKLLYADDYVQERLNKNSNFEEKCDTKAGSTTLGSVHIIPNEAANSYNANVHIVGNSAFFVMRADGKLENILYSRECLDSPRFCGVDLGKNTYEVYVPKDDTLWEVKQEIALHKGDICFFTTDGLASAFYELLHNPSAYFELSEGEDLNTEFAKCLNSMTDADLDYIRDFFIEREVISEDDVTLITFKVGEEN